MITKLKIYLLLSLLPTVFAAEAVESPDSAYAAGRYGTALEDYAAIMKKEGPSSPLLYNMANCYLREGDYGRAAAMYMRALRMDPGNKEARNNLEYLQERVAEANKGELKGRKASLRPDDVPFFTRVGISIMRDRKSDTWAAWAAVTFLLSMLSLALFIFAVAPGWRRSGFFSSLVTFACSLVFIVFAFKSSGFTDNRGVLLEAKVNLHREASEVSKQTPVALTRGTIVEITDLYPQGDPDPKWLKVRLNSDFNGWLPAAQVEWVDQDAKRAYVVEQ